MRDIRLSYNEKTDELNIGINCFVVCGDADGDGDPSVTSLELTQRGGQDAPNLGLSESFAFAFDLNVDGVMDFVLGVPASQPASSQPFTCGTTFDTRCFGLYRYLDTKNNDQPGQRFLQIANDMVLPHPTRQDNIATTKARPDFEWTILNFNQLRQKFGVAAIDPSKEWSLNFLAFAGSFADDGIGEDSFPNSGPFATVKFPCKAYDACDVCGGNGSTCLDCKGIANGPNQYDACDVCAGDGRSCADCRGTPRGTLKYDVCDVCGGDGTGCRDCAGRSPPTARYDVCDVCAGDGKSCLDCKAIPNGPNKYDACDICAGDGKSCLDCRGVPNGPNKYDHCDVCAGNGSTCSDCKGVQYGTTTYDKCDVCGGDDSTCAPVDCTSSSVQSCLFVLFFC